MLQIFDSHESADRMPAASFSRMDTRLRALFLKRARKCMEETRTVPPQQSEKDGAGEEDLQRHKRRKRRRDPARRFWESLPGPVPDPNPTSEQIADELED
jgi:hypothetical protein